MRGHTVGGHTVGGAVDLQLLGHLLQNGLALGDVALSLGGEELVVAAALGHELAVVAFLNELAVLQDRDLGGHGGGGEAVGNEDGGLVGAEAVELVEDLLLGHGVEGVR